MPYTQRPLLSDLKEISPYVNVKLYRTFSKKDLSTINVTETWTRTFIVHFKKAESALCGIIIIVIISCKIYCRKSKNHE